MKGKKVDSEFLSYFITKCIAMNKFSSEDIVSQAKAEMADIDKKIMEVARLKLVRGKLQDVVHSFEKPVKFINEDEVKTLEFFKIQNQNICKYICETIKKRSNGVGEISNTAFDKEDLFFAIKQLIEGKVLRKSGLYLYKAENFDEYCKFALIGE